MLELVILRHGEPVGGPKYRGQTDDPLSEHGWRQMQAAVHGHGPWQQVVSSPLRRCLAFAGDLAARQNITIVTDPRLREISFGAWEGMTVMQVKAAYSQSWHDFYQNPVLNTPPVAEPLPVFQRRVHEALQALIGRHREGKILLVAHAGVIRMSLNHLLGFPLERTFRIAVPYACMSRIGYHGNDHRSPSLLSHAAGPIP